jgi:hypothetical protein
MTDLTDRKELHWLEDINEAIEKIQGHEKYSGGREALETDEHYRVWVFYYIERIGECASQLRKDFAYDTKHPEIDWKGAQACDGIWFTDTGRQTRMRYGKVFNICQKSKRKSTS